MCFIMTLGHVLKKIIEFEVDLLQLQVFIDQLLIDGYNNHMTQCIF